MQFLQANILWALIALAIPIVIHLFHFRRFKKVYFTNVAFLNEVKQEVATRRRIRNWLVLLARLLAMAGVILAFAQPVIRGDEKVQTGVGHAIFILDNSFSMMNEYQDAHLLERAKQRAAQIAEALPESYKTMLITNDLEARHLKYVPSAQVSQLIQEVESSPRVFDWPLLHDKAIRLLREVNSDNLQLFVFSDFILSEQAQGYDQDTLVEYNFVPFRAVQESNVAIDTAWFLQPTFSEGQEVQVVIQVQNYHSESVSNIRLEAKVEGQHRPIANLNIEALGSHTDTLRFIPKQSGWQSLELKISDYPVQFDDTYYLSYNVAENLQVLLIHEGRIDRYMQAVLEVSPVLDPDIVTIGEVPYSSLGLYSLVIVQELRSLPSGLQSSLRQFVENGGQLFFVPAADGDLESYNSFLRQLGAGSWDGFRQKENQVVDLVREESLFSDVFDGSRPNLSLPRVTGQYTSRQASRGASRSVLRFRDGSPFLYRVQVEGGNAYLMTAPLALEYNNLVGNAEIFVPMLYKMALGTQSRFETGFVIGRETSMASPLRVLTSGEVMSIHFDDQEFIPRQSKSGGKWNIALEDEVLQSGVVSLKDGEDLVALWSANYDRSESNLKPMSGAGFEQWVGEGAVYSDADTRGDFAQMVTDETQGRSLWRWCIIFALIFLAVESIVLRWWKV